MHTQKILFSSWRHRKKISVFYTFKENGTNILELGDSDKNDFEDNYKITQEK